MLSERFGIPSGSRSNQTVEIPPWIWRKDEFLISYLRGLYEGEGSFAAHEPTYTYKMIFTNQNESLLQRVYESLEKLGLHPHRSLYKIQISKKDEVFVLRDMLNFRKYQVTEWIIAGSYSGNMRVSGTRHLGSNPSPAAKKSKRV